MTIGYQEVALDMIFAMLTMYEYQNGTPVQLIMAFVIPAFRMFNEWMLPKFFNKALCRKDEAATFLWKQH